MANHEKKSNNPVKKEEQKGNKVITTIKQ